MAIDAVDIGKILIRSGSRRMFAPPVCYGLVCCVLVFCVLLAGQANGQMRGSDGTFRPAPVVVRPVTCQTINDRLTAIGTGQALGSVSVTPWSSGKLTRFHVKAGVHVKAGQALAELDSDTEQIMVERARLDLDDTKQAFERLTRLRDSDTASPVQLINAELALARARLALRDAELALERRTIRAPIDGIVGILAIDAGNYVTASTMIARIDNRDRILIDVWLPERFATQISLGSEITARAVAGGGEIYGGHVSAVDNALDEASRTLRVRAEIVNQGDRLRAGMSFSVSFRFAGESFASVDPLAIQWRSEGAYVWRIDGQANAQRVPVTIIQRGSDKILVRGELRQDQLVVIQGVHNVREGMPVIISNETDLLAPKPKIEAEAVSSIEK